MFTKMPYYNVWPGAVYCCLNKNYNVYKFFNMTLHAGLANPTCLQSFMIWYCLVSELRCLNSKKKKKEKKMKNCGLWENRHFLFNPFPMHEFT